MIILIIMGLQINAWIIPIICILVPFLCWLSIRYLEYFDAFRKLNSVFGKPKALINSTKKDRSKLIESLLDKKLWV